MGLVGFGCDLFGLLAGLLWLRASGDAVYVVFLGLDVIVSRLRGFGVCVICGGCVFALFTVLWVLVGGGGVGSGLVVYSDMGLVGCRYDSVWLGSAVLFGLVVGLVVLDLCYGVGCVFGL